MLFGLVGNALVIAVILRNAHMRTSMHLILLNLALADVLFCSVCVPFVTYHYVADDWLLGDAICRLFQYIFYCTVYVTVSLLVLISLVRYCTVVHGASVARYLTRRNIVAAIVAVWVVMLACNVPILMLYRVKSFVEDNGDVEYRYCAMSSTQAGRNVSVVFFLLTYLLPLCALASIYVQIFRFLDAQRRRAFQGASKKASVTQRARERTSHATRVCFVVVLIFSLMWLPLNLHLLLAYFGLDTSSRAYQVFRIIAHFLAYANSCLNPLIYNCTSSEFQAAFRNIVRCSSSKSSNTQLSLRQMPSKGSNTQLSLKQMPSKRSRTKDYCMQAKNGIQAGPENDHLCSDATGDKTIE